ncbi:hypothetical protein B7492_31995 (plasmid) [Bacillus mycoides]|uniref:Crystaline entomocidal protoxin n=1 Tax=Bacillus mycoides TaxID=1405 RepID=A0A1W6AIQ7_BACMY|nr:insecticidal delta-endotoxin Cry8Ea1 family protein [Bacillus mycoides]ARJ25665.1 hypothetical protein B7492_31995 [Bacillus mycoides]
MDVSKLCLNVQFSRNGMVRPIAVIGAILALVPSPGAPIGAVFTLFTTIIPYLWPRNETIVWEEFTHRGLNLIRPELTPAEIEIIVTPLKGYYNALREQLENFEREFAIWDRNKNAATTGDVLRRFSAIDAAIISLKHQLTVDVRNKPALLSLYAQTANIDLILFQRGAKYGDEWARYARNQPIPFKTSKEYYSSLIEKIKTYTNDIAETYRNGLNIIKNKPNISWDIFNQYRREMNLSALDLVALFPNYDICKYPISTKTELTRKVYMSSFYLQALEQRENLESLENQLTHPPSLFTWLNGLSLYTIRENFNPALQVSSLSGLQATSRYTQNPTILPNPAQGIRNGTPTPIGLNNLFIYKLSMSQYHDPNGCYPIAGISDMTFYKSDYNGNSPATQTYQAGRNSTNIINTFMNGPQNASTSNNISIKQTNHILSDIKMTYSRTGGIYPLYTFGYSFAWTHTSVDPDNLIVPNRITQIPAVKANYISPSSRVVKGPGHTGGDLLRLDDMEVTCKLNSRETENYKIRLRYAANKEVRLRINLFSIPTVEFYATSTLQTGSNLDYLKYEDFGYVDIPVNIAAYGEQRVGLANISPDLNAIILVDRIEFIPVNTPKCSISTSNTTTLEYEGERNLEKTKNAVNDLFTN